MAKKAPAEALMIQDGRPQADQNLARLTRWQKGERGRDGRDLQRPRLRMIACDDVRALAPASLHTVHRQQQGQHASRAGLAGATGSRVGPQRGHGMEAGEATVTRMAPLCHSCRWLEA